MQAFSVLLYYLLEALFEVDYQVLNLLVLFHSFKKYVFMDLVDQLLKNINPILKLVGATIMEALIIWPAMKWVNCWWFARVIQTLRLIVLGGLHFFEHTNFLLLCISSWAKTWSHLLFYRMLWAELALSWFNLLDLLSQKLIISQTLWSWEFLWMVSSHLVFK